MTVYDLHFGDGSTERLSLVSLGSGLYRAEESSLWNESILLGTVIAGEAISATALRFLGVAQKSPYVTTTWVISKELVESPQLVKFLEHVSGAGGFWERTLGGLLFLHLPPGSPLDAGAELKSLAGRQST